MRVWLSLCTRAFGQLHSCGHHHIGLCTHICQSQRLRGIVSRAMAAGSLSLAPVPILASLCCTTIT